MSLSFEFSTFFFWKKKKFWCVTAVQVAWTLLQRCASADAKSTTSELRKSTVFSVSLRRLHPKGLFRVDAEMTEDPGGGKCNVAMHAGWESRWNWEMEMEMEIWWRYLRFGMPDFFTFKNNSLRSLRSLRSLSQRHWDTETFRLAQTFSGAGQGEARLHTWAVLHRWQLQFAKSFFFKHLVMAKPCKMHHMISYDIICIVLFVAFCAVLLDFFHFAFFVSKPASMQGDSMFSVEDVFSQFDVLHRLMPLDVGRNETAEKQQFWENNGNHKKILAKISIFGNYSCKM